MKTAFLLTSDALWGVLCTHLQRDFTAHDAVLEIGGAYCNFINNVNARGRRIVDLYPDLPKYAAPGVKAHVQSRANLDSFPS